MKDAHIGRNGCEVYSEGHKCDLLSNLKAGARKSSESNDVFIAL
jgi:hypothetical protein